MGTKWVQTMDYKNLNKLRAHNKKETVKHFMIKAMVLKVLINANYYVYSEKEISKYFDFKDKITKVADIVACDKKDIWEKKKTIIVEVETKPMKKHNRELLDFYEEYNLYIIDVRKIPDDLIKMEEKIKHILGM